MTVHSFQEEFNEFQKELFQQNGEPLVDSLKEIINLNTPNKFLNDPKHGQNLYNAMAQLHQEPSPNIQDSTTLEKAAQQAVICLKWGVLIHLEQQKKEPLPKQELWAPAMALNIAVELTQKLLNREFNSKNQEAIQRQFAGQEETGVYMLFVLQVSAKSCEACTISTTLTKEETLPTPGLIKKFYAEAFQKLNPQASSFLTGDVTDFSFYR